MVIWDIPFSDPKMSEKKVPSSSIFMEKHCKVQKHLISIRISIEMIKALVLCPISGFSGAALVKHESWTLSVFHVEYPECISDFC
jgi:hypothetical protein